MSLKIEAKTENFDLKPNFTIEIEDTSPIYNERGSQSVAATLPATNKNIRLTNNISRIDTDNSPVEDARVTVSDGIYRRIGKMNITQASRSGGIVCNFGFDESEIYNIWNAVSLQTLTGLPVIKDIGGPLGAAIYLSEVMNEKRKDKEFFVFQICVANPSKTTTENDQETTTFYPEYLNRIYKSSSEGDYSIHVAPRNETYLLNDDPVETSLPAGYGCTGFLKVSYLLDFIFKKYGYTVVENPFLHHQQLSRLCVLNNAADVCVKGFIDCADFLPDCTINEFLQALYCRFGMVYFIDGKLKEVKMKLLKDIIDYASPEDWSLSIASEPIISYNAPSQLRLSASTNIEGAAPANENINAFLLKYRNFVTTNVDNGYLYHDKVHGRFLKKNLITKEIETMSPDSFPWDRLAEISYEDIASVDESLPMISIDTAHPFTCPAYLLGKVHRYTNLASATVELSDEQGKKTPLCFCFAPPPKSGSYPFGSPRCYNPEGNKITGFEFSLSFIGKEGLFNHFWKKYDAILRHANHTIEADMHLNNNRLLNNDTSKPITINGQRLLLDSIRYTLPLSMIRPSEVKYRTLKLLKPYDLEKEQSIPIKEAPNTGYSFFSDLETEFEKMKQIIINEERIKDGVGWWYHESSTEIITKPKEDEFDIFEPPTNEEATAGYTISRDYRAICHCVFMLTGKTRNAQREFIYHAGIRAIFLK